MSFLHRREFCTQIQSTMTSRKDNSMKTVRTIIREIVNHELDERGLLSGDLAQVLSENIWTAIQERKYNRGDACPVEWMTELYNVCGIDPYTASQGIRGQVSDCGKALIQSGAQLGDLGSFVQWWHGYIRNWSIDSKYPTPKQIRDNWGKFKASNASMPLVVK